MKHDPTNDDKKSQDNNTELLVKVIDAFKENAIVQREQISSQHEHLKHDKHAQAVERKYNRRTNLAIAIITLVGVAVTVFIGLYVSAKENEIQRKFQIEQEIQTQAREKGQELNIRIRDEIEKRDALNNAISKIRYVREVNLLNCKNEKFMGNFKEYETNYSEGIYQFVNAWFGLSGVFDDQIINQSRDFLHLLDTNRHICRQDSIPQEKIQIMHRELNLLMNNAIMKDKEKTQAILSRENELTK